MLRVCSIASIVLNVEQSLLVLLRMALHAIKCCSVVSGVTLKLFVVNISLSFPAIYKLRRLLRAIYITTYGTVVRRRLIDNT